MGIVTVPTGNDYSRMAAEVINASWQQALDRLTDMDAKVTAATGGWLDTTVAPHVAAGTVTVPTVTEPSVTIPSSIDTSTILAEFESEYLELVALLSGKFTTFIGQYFPNDAADYAASESWVMGAVANPNSGLPIAVQNQVTADDHARVTLESNRSTATLMQRLSAMRHPMPAGAAASGQLQIQQNKQNLMAESSRKITMASVDMMKFAVEKALSLRPMAMSAALDYIKALASAPDIASRVVGIGYDAQTKLISAVTGWYNARIEVQKLASSVAQFNVSTDLSEQTKNQDADLVVLKERVNAMLNEIRLLAQMVTAWANNLHASAGVSASDSNSHSY